MRAINSLRKAFAGLLVVLFLSSLSPALAQTLTFNNVGAPTQVGSGAGKRAI